MRSLDFLHQRSNLRSRELDGYVFGGYVLPAWVIFHSMLGYVLVVLGIVALALRLPKVPGKRMHPYFGYAYLWGIVWMPITAIWCVIDGPVRWDIIAYFIFSMFAAAEIGWVFIRVFIAGKWETIDTSEPTRTRRWMKILHGIFMIYSLVMLLGAGISFPFRVMEG
ncbi:MAG: hypothetical protein GOMPHAMPRED_003355 [Gomphillus americanus]|uniref:Uncharacterized protein n=1 Tax=Gomphillus americanus TaxID=1940652 RepID=A0A8H3I9Y0_9LECA|nr:MAG: hypothetical protein GOMPHAMPRED_003355 [Gomphillus americanus]